MSFQKIEMQGFKSFADKTQIKFESGITCIVGPNGCGKSNVADAIRWVIGEQRAKNLRGSSMQDVIFNGTEKRKALSFCEVSLHFDNSKGIFPKIPQTEVVITRKIYRSGESEYLINHQKSKLKDIVNLLHDCGIAKDGYSIIGQGKVEEVLSSKPEDRRAIFEEATGISKFKKEKRENEAKLFRTRDNLERYEDIMKEIDSQLRPLERQAEKAKKHQELSGELKHHEINLYIYKHDNASVTKDRISAKIKEYDVEIESNQAEYIKAQEEYAKRDKEINNIDADTNRLYNELLVKSQGYERQKGESNLHNERMGNVQKRIEELNQKLDYAKQRKIELSEELSIREREVEETKTLLQINEGELKQKGEEYDRIIGALSQGEEEKEQKQRDMLASMEALSEIKANLSSLVSQKTSFEERKKELEDKVSALKEKIDSTIAENEDLIEQRNGLKEALEDIKERIKEHQQKEEIQSSRIREIDAKLFSLNTSAAKLEERENFLESVKNAYEGYQQSVKNLLLQADEHSDIKAKIKGVVASVIRTEKNYELAIETVLGASSQNVITDNDADAKYLIEFLKRSNGGRVTFLPVNTAKVRPNSDTVTRALRDSGAVGLATELVKYDSYYKNIISALLGNTLVCDNVDNALVIAKKYGFAFRIVTLDGELLGTGGAITGGSRNQNRNNLLSNERELADTKEKIARVKEGLVNGAVAKEKATALKEEESKMIARLQAGLNSKETQMAALEEKYSGIEKNILEKQAELKSYEFELEKINVKLDYIANEYEKADSSNKEIEARQFDAKSKAESGSEEVSGLKNQRDVISNEYTSLQIQNATLKSKLSTCENDVTRIGEELLEIEEQRKLNDEELSACQKTMAELQVTLAKSSVSLAEKEEIDNIKIKLSSLDEMKEKLKAEREDADRTRQLLNEKITTLTEKRHNEDVALTKVDSDLEYMQQKILEDYGFDYDMCLQLKEDSYDILTSQENISRLKKEIISLGAINPNAVEDFEIQSERYKAMSVQRDDLLSAANDIQKIIDELSTKMLAMFTTGFEKIRENFKQTFSELFGGGSAELSLDLTDEEGNEVSPLDAGIEITAVPSGKTPQKLSLLSGGERALTASAILFAILKLRPMPFCVLDEIEAALDEANVDRFARYLKNYADDTQFIVITHRKPTMELADSLFGVTMQEKGVSSIVSVKLSDVETNKDIVD